MLSPMLLAATPAPSAEMPVAASGNTAAAPSGEQILDNGYRVAQAPQMLDNWQSRAFHDIEEQRRLDELPRMNRQLSTQPQTKRAAPAREPTAVKLQRKPSAEQDGSAPHEAGDTALPEAPVAVEMAGSGAEAGRFDVVRDPQKLQACLQEAGYYQGAINGHLDKTTFAAFQKFRLDKRLQQRPEDLFDPIVQSVLFGSCTETAHENVSEHAMTPMQDDEEPTDLADAAEAFAGPLPASPEGGMNGLASSSAAPASPYAMAPAPASSKPAFASSSRVRINDLFSARPANPNTCSPQEQGGISTYAEAPLPGANGDPLVTGALSGSAHGQAIAALQKSELRLARIEQEQECLPRDLYDMLKDTYGDRAEVTACESACLPAPTNFSDGQMKLFAEQYAISWCAPGCLAIADPMPLAEVMKIEREARVQVCMKPQTRLMQAVDAGLDRSGVSPAIRALYERLPGGYGNADNIAVIIGNRNYRGGLPLNAAAHVEAAAMRTLLVDQLGYKADNVILVKDAARDDFIRLFGGKDNAAGELVRRLKSNPNAQLMIYYAGHASSQALGLENYLLPVDAIAGKEAAGGYALDLLYENLRRLDARSTLLFLEAGFSDKRGEDVLAPNVTERRVMAAPVTPVRGLALFTAAEGDQKPLIDPETGIGLFTRHLIAGLAGRADAAPYGNGDSILDSVELHVHIARNVRLAARKTLGLMQSPTLSRADTLFLSQLSRR